MAGPQTFQSPAPGCGAGRGRCTPWDTLQWQGSDARTCASRATSVSGQETQRACRSMWRTMHLQLRTLDTRPVHSISLRLASGWPSALLSTSWSARSVAMQHVQEHVLKSFRWNWHAVCHPTWGKSASSLQSSHYNVPRAQGAQFLLGEAVSDGGNKKNSRLPSIKSSFFQDILAGGG